MYTTVKIIRAVWGDSEKTRWEVPPFPIYSNQIVYVWGIDNEKWLKERGYETRLIEESKFIEYATFNGQFLRKLIALDLALQEFGEVILLDWDCYILRELDDNFYELLKEKPIQCPLYAHHIDVKKSCLEVDTFPSNDIRSFIDLIDVTIKKYSWKHDGILVSPNFCFVYSRDIELGKKLIDITLENNIMGCIEEHAMFLYANCTVDEYIDRYQPKVVNGTSDTVTINDLMSERSRKQMNNYIANKIDLDIYLEHI
jgi:hypothetical protein